MKEYLATFHTHFAAMCTARALENAGVNARLAPVPRAVSASCGTCVLYTAQDPCLSLMARDTEGVYLSTAHGFTPIRQFE